MPFGRSEAKREERERARDEKDHAKKLKEFMESPIGLAFQARHHGERFYLVELDLATLTGTAFWGSATGRVRHETGSAGVLAEIEQIGWRLEHASWVFMETGTTSSDHTWGTGQGTAVRGKVIGVYLFREADSSPEWADGLASGEPPIAALEAY